MEVRFRTIKDLSDFSECRMVAGAGSISVGEVCDKLIKQLEGMQVIQNAVSAFYRSSIGDTEGTAFSFQDCFSVSWVGGEQDRVTVGHDG